MQSGEEQEGFTLIELMVVVLIIAILIAIAIPTFIGARHRAQDRAAQTQLRDALLTEKTFYTDVQYFTATPALLIAEQGFLVWVAAGPAQAGQRQVAVGVTGTGNGARVWLQSQSRSGRDFCMAELADGGTFYNSTPDATTPTCFGDPGVNPLATGWTRTGF